MVLISYFLIVDFIDCSLVEVPEPVEGPSVLSFGRPDVVKFFAKAKMGSKTAILLTKFPIRSDFR
jgi:hypothetical protein